MSMFGLVFVTAGVAVLYAQIHDIPTFSLWHAIREGGVTGLVAYVDQTKARHPASGPGSVLPVQPPNSFGLAPPPSGGPAA